MGIEEYPEVQEKIQAYILTKSVKLLHKEEVEDKVSVTEEEIINYYKENYERFILDLIEVNTEEDAGRIWERLKNGESFKSFSQKYPANYPGKDGEGYVFTGGLLRHTFRDAVYSLKPGEFSGITELKDKYYIIKLISRQDAPDKELERIRGRIESTIRKQKEEEREKKYLAQLYEEANVNINQELVSSIRWDKGSEEREQWLKDTRPLIEIHDEVFTVKEFVKILPSTDDKVKEKTMKKWLDYKLVDREALRRHYEIKNDLKEMVQRYKDQVLRDTFIKRIIKPQINISAQDLEDYYVRNKEDFTKPVVYKVQQITVKTREEAEEVLKSLHGGANFSWLAKKKSIDSAASMGGVIGWVIREKLSEPAGEIIDTLKPGEISPILKIGSLYRIIRLQEKTQEEIEEFSKVKALVHKKLSREKFNELYSGYVDKLRKEAQITIYSEAIESFEKMLRK